MIDLGALSPDDEGAFGGKAAGLARLLRAGAAVPPGFAVEADRRDPGEWSAGERAAFRERVGALLAGGPVAVRSSAVGEDSAARSFAGLFETVLGARDVAEAEAAARRCLASAGSGRVRAYLGGGPVPAIGLVVQGLVEPHSAGVCFTADPAGRDAAVLVEAVAGRGDALVSGQVQPERWRVYRSGFGRLESRREDNGGQVVLDASQAEQIAGAAAGLARRIGRPLDLEWALGGAGRLFWLQARPITALKQPPSWDVERFCPEADDGPVSIWANWNLREVMPDPMPPLAWDLWSETVLPIVAEPLFGVPRTASFFRHVVPVDLVHGRVYWNMNAFLAVPVSAAILPRLLAAVDARAAEVTRPLLASGVLRGRRLPGSRWLLARALGAAAVRTSLDAWRAFLPRHVVRALMAAGDRVAARPPVASLPDADLLRELRLFESDALGPLRHGVQAVGLGVLALGVAELAFRRHPEARRLLASGVPGNPTTEISVGVDGLVEAARPLSALFAAPRPWAELRAELETTGQGRSWLEALARFLARSGQRCPGEFDITVPRWAEDPGMIVDLVRASLVRPAAETVAARLERLARERQAAVEAAARASPFWKRPLLRWIAGRVAAYQPLREAPKHAAMYLFQRIRLAALELGARLHARGSLAGAADVFFLRWGELRTLAGGGSVSDDLAGLLRERRARFARHRAERAPDFLRSDGVPVDPPAEPVEPGLLRGTATSHGRASGPVRILRTPDASRARDGDVLVLEYADPGWTPLFPRAAAVVMEVGGVMCHAAVVARELGLPAVFGVTEATRRLRDGQVVQVDGDAGTVRWEEAACPPSRGRSSSTRVASWSTRTGSG